MQALARHELRRPERAGQELPATELIAENRFLAARDGSDAQLIDADSGERIPATAQLERLLVACRRHADELGCARELATAPALVAGTGASRQLAHARDDDLRRVTAGLARAYLPGPPARMDQPSAPAWQAA